MKKTVYIHIGTHKTGTTAVQKFSADHTKELIKLGIFYPYISRPAIANISIGQHLLPWYLTNHPVPDDYYGQYADKKESIFPSLIAAIKSSECEKIILSSEEFDRLNFEQVKILKDYFEELDVKIIIYLRRKDSYLETMYQTNVVHGEESRNIVDALKNMDIPLDYFEFVKKWQDIFGEKNVYIYFYCKDILKANDIIIDFYDHLGVDVEEMVKKSATNNRINASIPFQYVTMIANMRRNNASSNTINLVKRVGKKMGDTADKSYHFLPLKERVNLAKSGLEEIERLNLNIPDKECFALSFDELKEDEDEKQSHALMQIFKDFENYMNKKD